MVPKKKSTVLVVGLAVLIAGCGRPSNVAKQPDHDMTNAIMELTPYSRSDYPVHTIAMPHDEPVFPPGPGREEFVTACVVCHSPRYITMQPRFSRTTWLSEVKKMKDVYGAHISEDQVQKITEYLVSINGQLDTGQAPKGTYGE
jgi:mono/diheme cytochrome c family protein